MGKASPSFQEESQSRSWYEREGVPLSWLGDFRRIPRSAILEDLAPMGIRLFITGGTFDKQYDEIQGRLHFRETHIHEMLRLGRCRVAIAVETLMMLDSLEMTADDRHTIRDQCRLAKEEQIVITHGTDTMTETARVLGLAHLPKTIVLTGAMVPYAFGSSDGLFNLGSALSFVQTLPHGVYVAMNGRAFSWDNVTKNLDLGVFEAQRT
jgi:L-asparaginase